MKKYTLMSPFQILKSTNDQNAIFYPIFRFFKGNVKNYHIRNNDGYFLRAFDVDTGSTYMTYEKQSQTKFPNITDLIDFFKYTSDKSE